MPEFVQSVANQQMPPPYRFPGVTAHGFVFKVSMDAVQHYCDTYFNLGDPADRGFTYRCMPLFPYASLMAIQYPVMMSECRAELGDGEISFADRGYISQNEIFVAVPVVRYGTNGTNILLDAALEWALPFIAVDNSTSAFSGREMLGLQKLKGELTFGVGASPGSFAVQADLPGWKALRPGVVQESLRFLTIETGPPVGMRQPTDPASSPWSLLGGAYVRQAIEAMGAMFTGLDTLSLGLMPTPMQVVALKQFRDAARPDTAVYQALVGARTRYSNISNLQFYNENDVSIAFNDYGSFQQVIRVFLKPPEDRAEHADEIRQVKVPVCSAYSFTADIDFDTMRTMHTFIADSRPVSRAQQPQADSMLAPWFLPWRGFFAPR